MTFGAVCPNIYVDPNISCSIVLISSELISLQDCGYGYDRQKYIELRMHGLWGKQLIKLIFIIMKISCIDLVIRKIEYHWSIPFRIIILLSISFETLILKSQN